MVRRCGKSLALLACLGLVGAVTAQPAPFDSVDRLRQTLRAAYTDLAQRERVLRQRVAALRTAAELRRAYALPDWRDRSPDTALAHVDRTTRTELANRLVAMAGDLARQGDAVGAAAALDQIAELAAAARTNGDAPGLVRSLTPELIRLTREGAPPVRAAAARTLGQVDPPLDAALPAPDGPAEDERAAHPAGRGRGAGGPGARRDVARLA